MTTEFEDRLAGRAKRSRRQLAALLLFCGFCVLAVISSLIPGAAMVWVCLLVVISAAAAFVTVRNWAHLSPEWRIAGLQPWILLVAGLTGLYLVVRFG